MDSTMVIISDIAEKLSKNSGFDTASIFVVVSLVMFTGIFISIGYKVLISQFKRTEDLFKALERIISDKFVVHQGFCMERNVGIQEYFKDNFQYVDTIMSNMFNTFVEILSKAGNLYIETWLALALFEIVMELHCLKKASIMYKKMREKDVTTEDIIQSLSHEFRDITEREKSILDKIYYTNGHRLGEEFDEILEEENWDNFMENKVGMLIRRHIGRNYEWTTLKEQTVTAFSEFTRKAKESIKRKGSEK